MKASRAQRTVATSARGPSPEFRSIHKNKTVWRPLRRTTWTVLYSRRSPPTSRGIVALNGSASSLTMGVPFKEQLFDLTRAFSDLHLDSPHAAKDLHPV
jgi:hypothetical protein